MPFCFRKISSATENGFVQRNFEPECEFRSECDSCDTALCRKTAVRGAFYAGHVAVYDQAQFNIGHWPSGCAAITAAGPKPRRLALNLFPHGQTYPQKEDWLNFTS